MRSSELRIGNLVHYRVEDDSDDRKKWDELNVVGAEDISSIGGYEVVKRKSPYHPIPLTKEWLLRLRFHKDNYGVFYKTQDNTKTSRSIYELWVKQCKPNGRWVYDVSIGRHFFDTTHLCFIKHVHQLQNVYFAITGKELKNKQIKDKPKNQKKS